MAKLHFFAGVVKLPAISSVVIDGKYIELVFKDRCSVFRCTPSSVFCISDLDIDDIEEENYGLSKAHEKKLVSEKFPKRSRSKKS